MSTLNDIHGVWKEISKVISEMSIFGVTPGILGRFEKLTTAARDAIMEDRGLDDPDQVAALPKDTVLGEKAEAVLADLEAFFQK